MSTPNGSASESSEDEANDQVECERCDGAGLHYYCDEDCSGEPVDFFYDCSECDGTGWVQTAEAKLAAVERALDDFDAMHSDQKRCCASRTLAAAIREALSQASLAGPDG